MGPGQGGVTYKSVKECGEPSQTLFHLFGSIWGERSPLERKVGIPAQSGLDVRTYMKAFLCILEDAVGLGRLFKASWSRNRRTVFGPLLKEFLLDMCLSDFAGNGGCEEQTLHASLA